MMKSCSFCGAHTTELLRCSRCKAKFYCSRMCQQNHWKEGHKMECREERVEEKKNLCECSFCGVHSSDLKRCSRCKGKSCCSQDCQQKHWIVGHNKECKKKSKDESTSPVLICTSCKKSSEQLKRCTGCLQVSYCSRECQVQDWNQKHKDECVKIHVQYKEDLQEVEKEDQKDDVFSKEKSDNGHKSLNMCTVCGKKGTMKVCQRCKIQKYCSPECQKADWQTHKSHCSQEEKSTSRNEKVSDVPSPICANCRSQSARLRCSGCRVVYYCSKDCQMTDWNKHKTSCKAYKSQPKVRETLTIGECSMMGLVTPEEHGGRNQNDGKLQLIGEKSDFTNFSCNRCLQKIAPGNFNVTCNEYKTAIYCSNPCMELDKSEHRKTCATSYIPGSGNTMSSCVKNDANGQSIRLDISPSHAHLPYTRNPLFVEENVDLNWIVERTAQSCSEAIEKTKRKFPYYTMITRLREIPIEERSMLTSNICTLPYVFLAYIRRFHKYRGCHNVYLQDSERREIYASFYLPNDDPTPYFEWSDLVPGKFVAILFPCIHFFLDSTVGLRVDKSKNFYCFDVED
ncbi:uncharacterized protein LOC134250136 isoform X2 [Saccostrea cucullata]|uniref:uncharacterized protein LOC134250136 isoform X2 n=1 Tax=Saccostrea cuccullata TaxID=36930 RepID=UPI002ED56D13